MDIIHTVKSMNNPFNCVKKNLLGKIKMQ